ncbi:MAG: hypothetical protein Q9202_006704 [Teloschistes flavicans]
MFRQRFGNIAASKEQFERLKDHYKKQRDEFRNDPRSAPELEAWRKQDNDFAYNLLNGTQKSFEYADHNPREFILSESSLSYIIGNLASYDSRQYPLSPNDKRPEGQGFCHTLVISKARVYNVVDPDATANKCSLLKEMHDHFVTFWQHDQGKEKILARAKRAVDDQDKKLRDAPSPSSNSQSTGSVYDDATRSSVFAQFNQLKDAFKKLQAKDFVFAFHVFPDNSIGHLHMHVFPHDEAFREFSTHVYDWKTVPLQAVLEVEEA